MRIFPSGLAAHYALQNTTLAAFLEIERRDGLFARFTGADRDVAVDGETYISAQGLDLANLTVSSGAEVDTVNITIFPDGDELLEADLLAGRWNFARFRLFETSYEDPSIGINVVRRGWTGEADTTSTAYQIELRSMKQALQQALGRVTTKTCPYRFGSTAQPLGLCLIDLGPFTNTYEITALDTDQPRRKFTCSAATEVDDYYGEGIATAVDGEAAGYAQKIRSFSAGVFELSLDMHFALGIGDHVTVIAGCRKRLIEDCKTKFDNVLNFGGEPDMVGQDQLTADPVTG